MNDEIDPEVLADLRLRASSERDSSRARPSASLLGTWKPDEKPAGMWRCRGRGKGKAPCPSNAIVPVMADTMERLMIFNQRLRSMGEDPIDTDDVVRCDPCQRAINAARSGLLRQRIEEMAQVIRDVKASGNPRGERAKIAQLEKWGHPDVAGLLQAIEDRLRGGKGKRMGRDSL
jgi:hypothetical protein